MNDTRQMPKAGDALEHRNGEYYLFNGSGVACGECNAVVNFSGECPNGHRASDPGTSEPEVFCSVENIRNGERYEWSESETVKMISNGWLRRETPRTVEDVDDLSEDELYRYEHADEGDDSRTFRVNLRYQDSDDFADYGEGAIQFEYLDGYVADIPVSRVEEQTEANKIERID